MAESVLSYRVSRLRRLIVVCLGLGACAVALGMWLVPGQSAFQVVVGLGIFSIFAMAQLAMILLWPRDHVEPLIYALGLVPVLGLAMPFIANRLDVRAEVLTAGLLILMFGPLVWLIGVRAVGWLMLKPFDLIPLRNVVFQAARVVPLAPDAARACFFAAPHKARRDMVTGPVEWDGFFVETTQARVAGPSSGEVTKVPVTMRLRILEEDALSQGLLVQAMGVDGKPVSVVLHQSLTPDGAGTRLMRRYTADRLVLTQVMTGWLGDVQQDSITAMLDEAQGLPPRANVEEPLDSMTGSLARWLRWHEPAPGG